jgi:hypothetical protein
MLRRAACVSLWVPPSRRCCAKATGWRAYASRRADVVKAELTVLALGSYSPLLLRPLGVACRCIPAKGYSATLVLPEGVVAPTVSLTDDGHKLVISRLGQRLRVAGTAEFNGYDTSLNPVRCAALLKRIVEIFPSLAAVERIDYWAGLRPATPGQRAAGRRPGGRRTEGPVAQYRPRHAGLDAGLRFGAAAGRSHRGARSRALDRSGPIPLEKSAYFARRLLYVQLPQQRRLCAPQCRWRGVASVLLLGQFGMHRLAFGIRIERGAAVVAEFQREALVEQSSRWARRLRAAWLRSGSGCRGFRLHDRAAARPRRALPRCCRAG